MKNLIKYPYYLTTLSMCIGANANAQKLPNVQPAAVYAPANIKVDGKATEWNNQFQAYNKSTSVYYTMANNSDNLYLAVQATDKTVLEKILTGGITLTISSNDKSIVPVSIASPRLSPANKSKITQKTNSKEPLLETDLPELNRVIANGLKEIPVKGITAISDSAISVYNEYGIKIAGQVDINKAYTCELIIPLKYIHQLAGVNGNFNYNIKLNGASSVQNLLSQISPESIKSITVNGGSISINGKSMDELASPTDFSGTYTLIKK